MRTEGFQRLIIVLVTLGCAWILARTGAIVVVPFTLVLFGILALLVWVVVWIVRGFQKGG
jgi:hypothetical protein